MRAHRIFAACYDRMNGAAERSFLGRRREALLHNLTGSVLDVGAGTGANLPHLRSAERIVAVEPDPAMRARLAPRAAAADVPVEVSDASAEALPFADGSFDAVVFTLVLCTVADPDAALSEARRVLRDDGKLVLLEHVRGEGRLARVQDRITPVWKFFGAGCHPNRDTLSTLRRRGEFEIDEVEEFSEVPQWVPASPMIQVTARPTG
ncbi:class I SAM-dependent methyltransferase [Saccharomonospora xinjiangensis]|uniref:class I SAM-dependent methyltransferase n=1 Tax=Saccharomonospora xinjiangensis TaxID=75294 RepID=UPI00106FC020|nr:class I SAM-dependent methyltransferase [Saccharomonospora xinjiangensis]QBQ58647.1 Ubiquinone/menaquinone biosynthesis C-methyltransferase UbiE [Saccharomonospora xinjiangensis]